MRDLGYGVPQSLIEPMLYNPVLELWGEGRSVVGFRGLRIVCPVLAEAAPSHFLRALVPCSSGPPAAEVRFGV